MTKRAALESAVIDALDRTDQPMRWGRDDCALWVADAIRGPLGYDPAANVRGRYKTRRGANRIGLLGQIRKIARRHEWRRIDPRMAQSGDVGMAWVDYQGRAVLATVVCRTRGWFVGRAETGFAVMRAENIALAWSVLPDALQPGPGARVNLRHWRTQQPVPAEIVSTAIGLTSLIAGLGASAAVAGAIGGAIVTGALSIGVSLVSSMLQSHTGSTLSDTTVADTSPIRGAQITERQSVPYKRVIVGSAYVGGALFFEQVKPPYLTMGVLVNYGEISGIDKVFIGTNQLQFASLVPDTILTPIAVDNQPDYPNHLRASFRYGADSQAADPLILARYASVGSEFRQRGIATAVYEYKFGADQDAFLALWGQVSRPTAYTVARGVVCYDPRDPAQDIDDESTWVWTNNATLVETWYLTRPFGGRISMSRIRWDKIAASADWDDSLMGCNDGTLIRKHTIDGVIYLNQAPAAVMQDLLKSNRGMILESGGRIWIDSSLPKSPIATIHDRILAGGFNYAAGKVKSNLANKVQVRFVAPEQDYQVVDGPILHRTDLETADGEPLPATLGLNFTQDHRRAQRLQKCFLESSRLGRSIACTVDVRLLGIASDELVGSVVTFDSVLWSKANGDYLITAVGFADDCTTLSLALTEYDPTIETTWNPETDEQAFELATIDIS